MSRKTFFVLTVLIILISCKVKQGNHMEFSKDRNMNLQLHQIGYLWRVDTLGCLGIRRTIGYANSDSFSNMIIGLKRGILEYTLGPPDYVIDYSLEDGNFYYMYAIDVDDTICNKTKIREEWVGYSAVACEIIIKGNRVKEVYFSILH